MKKAILLVCLLALGACGTTHQNPKNGPATTRLSDKTPEAIVDCMNARAPNGYATSPILGGGFRLGAMHTYNSLEIRPKGEGSEISYYTLYGMTGMTKECI